MYKCDFFKVKRITTLDNLQAGRELGYIRKLIVGAVSQKKKKRTDKLKKTSKSLCSFILTVYYRLLQGKKP
jgi:hypothetical protein